ncbi:uncharacterized protein LOC130136132 [Syzygium oleosum]|uniref:uncharacterized protein LOC130136132 n=1 Tax=Syzygium oleosum TaxID=219896 RepID=UPI0024BA9FC8|nr:uncharacterized protein LOC130136132 [Syzygium oleosum]
MGDVDVDVVKVEVEEMGRIDSGPKKSRMVKNVGVELPKITESLGVVHDALATLSSMPQVIGGLKVEPLKIEVPTKPAYCMIVTEEPDKKPWYYDIMSYIQRQEFPEGSTPADRKYIMKMASKFFVSGEKLYKRSYNSILLRCVDA